MNLFRNDDAPEQSRAARTRTKNEAYAKVVACPLVQGCSAGGDYVRVLLGGFWPFVDAFPAIIRETYTSLPVAESEPVRRFLRRSAGILSGTLRGMEDDERAHRTLWMRSSRCVELSEDRLRGWRVLPEIRFLANAIRSEGNLGRRLLYFVAVEIVAASISRYLIQAPPFVEAMGEDGMEWFAAHAADVGDATTHEAIAYKLAFSVKRAANDPIDEESVNTEIQRCVDWFFSGALACVREFKHPGDGM